VIDILRYVSHGGATPLGRADAAFPAAGIVPIAGATGVVPLATLPRNGPSPGEWRAISAQAFVSLGPPGFVPAGRGPKLRVVVYGCAGNPRCV
jgi:hypothetical protein